MEHPSNDFDKLFGGDDDFDDGIDSDADTEKEEEEIAPGNKGKRYKMSYHAPKNSIALYATKASLCIFLGTTIQAAKDFFGG